MQLEYSLKNNCLGGLDMMAFNLIMVSPESANRVRFDALFRR